MFSVGFSWVFGLLLHYGLGSCIGWSTFLDDELTYSTKHFIAASLVVFVLWWRLHQPSPSRGDTRKPPFNFISVCFKANSTFEPAPLGTSSYFMFGDVWVSLGKKVGHGWI